MSDFAERMKRLKAAQDKEQADAAAKRAQEAREEKEAHDAAQANLRRTALVELRRVAEALTLAGFPARVSGPTRVSGPAYVCTLDVDRLGQVGCEMRVPGNTIAAVANPPFNTATPKLRFNVGDGEALREAVERWAEEGLRKK